MRENEEGLKMGDREFEYCPDTPCDVCGKRGAWDIYGDFVCNDCLRQDYTQPNDGFDQDKEKDRASGKRASQIAQEQERNLRKAIGDELFEYLESKEDATSEGR